MYDNLVGGAAPRVSFQSGGASTSLPRIAPVTESIRERSASDTIPLIAGVILRYPSFFDIQVDGYAPFTHCIPLSVRRSDHKGVLTHGRFPD